MADWSVVDAREGGFIKGTPVHTRDGLKPIEEIQAGDWVLSAPQDGTGTAGYKRVTNTFVYPQKTIRTINTYGAESGTQYFLGATGSHLFWVEGVGWTRADALGRHTVLRQTDGSAASIDAQWPVYRTEQPGIGWVQALSDVAGSYGGRFDYENYDLAPAVENGEYLPAGVLGSDDPFLRVTVYNLEVEDSHTCFVGYDGVWVHDATPEPPVDAL